MTSVESVSPQKARWWGARRAVFLLYCPDFVSPCGSGGIIIPASMEVNQETAFVIDRRAVGGGS